MNELVHTDPARLAVAEGVMVTVVLVTVPTTANFVHYAKIVKEKALLRNLITTATTIVSSCYDTSKDIDTILDKSEQLIFDVRIKWSKISAMVIRWWIYCCSKLRWRYTASVFI